jgi:glycosyltransferase involved in cell wall biosynthesis
MPKVSVIIPAYNVMAYLPETLESVLRQTFTDFEVLLINDGSTDGIIPWASQIKDRRVKLISQKNQGVSEARNTGIAHAQGEYIAFLDADDLWEPTKLEKQARLLDSNPAVGLVDTWVVLANEQGIPTDQVRISKAEGDVWKQIAEENLLTCGSTPMIRHCCFETVGVFNPNLRNGEDWDMWIRIASRYNFAVVKEPLVRYRQHPNNMSKNCQGMLPDLRTVIERTFQSAPSELLYLKNRAYGRANLYTAWRALETKDYKGAIHFRRQAAAYYPQLGYSESYIRLGLLIVAKRWFGSQGYSKLRSLVHGLRKAEPDVNLIDVKLGISR